ncbi:MAG TPA: DUF5666 domain-containing protein [Thermoanaerobaculia bacterium]|nr:DUF5666 domain-containing protein [Thermoanaerobaculia bacterium]
MKNHRFRCVTALAAAGALVFVAACSSKESPTSSRNSMISGQVVMGASAQTAGIRPEASASAANIAVRVESSNASAMTDAGGNFVLTGVPPGTDTLTFDRADVHARAVVSVPAGASVAITVSIHGNQATITPGGHPGAEIEGRVQTVDATGNTLTVADQRLGTVTITVTDTTSIRHGALALTLAQITPGMEVHVKGTLQDDGTYLATEILVQDLNMGGSQTVAGTIASVDSGTSSFVVGSTTIDTNSSTIYRKNGKAAAFSDLAMGMRVTVTGILQGDGSILASEVTITG